MSVRDERGASAVEFALVLPLLMVITFAIIEFGMLLYDKAVITNASREGARAAIVYNTNGSAYSPLSASDIKTIVKSYTNGINDTSPILINLGGSKRLLTDADIKLYCKTPSQTTWTSGSCTVSGNELKVEVNFTYNFLVFPNMTKLIGGSFNGSVPLKATTVMRME